MPKDETTVPRPRSSWKQKEWAVVAVCIIVVALVLIFKPHVPEPAPTKERPAVMKEIPAQPGTYPPNETPPPKR